MIQWKWNDVELEIDMEDADFQERYENAFERMENEEKEVSKIGKCSEITRAYCDMFYHLFDNIYGDGTGERLFSGKRHIGVINEAYDSWISHCRKDIETSNKKRAAMIGKYKVKSKR